MRLAVDHLWCQVVEGAAEGSPVFRGTFDVGAPTEVRELGNLASTHQNVLGLDVAMDDHVAVKVIQSACDACEYWASLRLGKPAMLLHHLVQRPPARILK
jgi:hypothetical protein